MRNVKDLRDRLREIEQIGDENWMSTLDERKKKELEFHDRYRDATARRGLDENAFDRRYANEKYYKTVASSEKYLEEWIRRNARDRVFLDYACGDGEVTIRAAKAGATLAIGIDISSVSVANARRSASEQGVGESTFFVQADAENTRFPGDCVDTVVCSGVLHHLDLSHAFPELCRILAPGGRALAVEALNSNPIIQLYRRMTPEMRTDWEKEHILGFKDIDLARRYFDIGEMRFWHITSVLAAHLGPLLPLLNGLDSILSRVPFVQRMAWMFTFELLSKKVEPA
jgi:SAM-dependent methyltransferase